MCRSPACRLEQAAETNALAIMESAQTSPPIAAGDKTVAEDEFVVVCAFCTRMRSREGPWISLPLWLGRILRQEPGRISHTYCPECLARHYPTHTESGRLRASCVEGKPAQAPLAIAWSAHPARG